MVVIVRAEGWYGVRGVVRCVRRSLGRRGARRAHRGPCAVWEVACGGESSVLRHNWNFDGEERRVGGVEQGRRDDAIRTVQVSERYEQLLVVV